MKGIIENIWGDNNFSIKEKKVSPYHKYWVQSRVNNSTFILWHIVNCGTSRRKRKCWKLPERRNNYVDKRYHKNKIDARRQWNKIFEVQRKNNRQPKILYAN